MTGEEQPQQPQAQTANYCRNHNRNHSRDRSSAFARSWFKTPPRARTDRGALQVQQRWLAGFSKTKAVGNDAIGKLVCSPRGFGIERRRLQKLRGACSRFLVWLRR
mmetsp:Transcript_14/g.53  ORF Transcript_14/g.53 Transcript_14/m.53 type:complete len:106 (-) Transcript_14:700-1017(-)